MGATLPTAVALYERSRHDGRSAGRAAGVLYALNTAGAVAGSLATALFLLPTVGMRVTTIGAASLNVLAATVVLLGIQGVVDPGEPDRPRARFSYASRIALAVVALSDSPPWWRWLPEPVLLIGPTTWVLVRRELGDFGLTLGSTAVRDRSGGRDRSLAWARLSASLASLALVQILGRLSLPIGYLVHRYSNDMTTLLGIELAAVAALLFLPSFFFGATFPLAVGVVSREGAGPAESTGATLAWNTAGALSGSLAAGFLLIPHLGAEGALYAARDPLVAGHLLHPHAPRSGAPSPPRFRSSFLDGTGSSSRAGCTSTPLI
jgi:spermidine synthase